MTLAAMRALLALAFLLLGGCQFDPYSSEYTRKQPVVAALPGTYALDAETKAWYSREVQPAVPPAMLELRRDGTFQLRNAPDCFHRIECGRGVISLAGKWQVEHLDETWSLSFDVSEENQRPARYFTTGELRSQEPPYLVHFIVGDPDSGRGVAFERHGG